MKIKDGYVLNEMGSGSVAIYIGEENEAVQQCVIKLNRLATFLWEQLAEGCTLEDLVGAVTRRYDVNQKKAAEDVEAFLSSLRENNVLEE